MMMRAWLGLGVVLTILVGPLTAAEGANHAAMAPLKDANLFISPSGQPFRSQPGQPYPVVAWFKGADANHDGRVDRAEFRADAERFFHLLDRNADGYIEEFEIYYYERVLAPEINAGAALNFTAGRLFLAQSAVAEPLTPQLIKEDEDQPPTVAGAANYGLLNDPEPVRSADQHLAGRISLADFLARADQNFDALSSKDRAYLTLDELPETPAQHNADLLKAR